MALPITITDAGRAEIINAENNGTGAVLITEIGFGTGQYTPAANQTVLQAQIKRVSSIAGQAVADDTIHVMAKDETASAYNVGEFGLFSDKGTLIAVYSQPVESGWIIQKAGPSTLLLATDIILESLNAASLTFGDILFINPPATTTVQGVVELATPEETQAGTDGARAVTPAGLKTLTGSTSRAGLLQLNNTLTSTSTSQALTAAQGKKLQDEKQPLDATLTALAALVTAANKLIYATGTDNFATTDLTAFARTLLDDPDAAAARATLDAQQQDPTLTALAGMVTAANKLIYATGADSFATTDLTAFARTLLDDPDAAAARATLSAQQQDATLTALAGVVTAANKLIYATGADNFATTDLTAFARSLLDDADAAAARSTLGLGNAAQATLTVSPEDTSIGRVLKVGDAGILSPINVGDNVTIAETASVPGGSYYRGANPLPSDTPSNTAVRWMNWGDPSWPMQLASAAYSERVWIRTRPSAGAPFKTWQELFHTGNHLEATDTEAQEGTSRSRWMSPLRVFNVIRSAATLATETMRGTTRVATQTEVNAGSLDNASVTPKKLRWGFAVSLAANGYVVFPAWLGSLIIQWGKVGSIASNSGVDVAFPLEFPAAVFGVLATPTGSAQDSTPDYGIHTRLVSNSGCRLANPDNLYAFAGAYWIALGN